VHEVNDDAICHGVKYVVASVWRGFWVPKVNNYEVCKNTQICSGNFR
jgi:hypothetical protein